MILTTADYELVFQTLQRKKYEKLAQLQKKLTLVALGFTTDYRMSRL